MRHIRANPTISQKACGSRASAPSPPCPHLLHGERGVHISVQRPELGQLLLHGLAVLHQLGEFLAHECRFLFGKVELTLQVGTVLLQRRRRTEEENKATETTREASAVSQRV